MESALSGYRALDLTDDKGFLCGRILGDLGVDVIKIEPLRGDPSRNIAPFYKDDPDPEKSLYWFAYNANKRGITLNIESEEGRDILRKLVQKSHFIIESFSLGYMDSIGLGYTQLARVNPAIIMTSITPFGQKGPYKDYKGSDIVYTAMSGFMYLCGDPDRPPVRIGSPQVYLHAGGEAAVQSLIAHYYRETTGRGQWIDISLQEGMSLATANASLYWVIHGANLKRAGSSRIGLSGGVPQRQVWPCKDGYVNFPTYGGALGARTNRSLAEWMDEEGMSDDFFRGIDWEKFDMGRVTGEVWTHMEELIGKFFQSHTKGELYRKARDLNIMIYPVSTPKDIAENEQLQSRQYWVQVEHPELNTSITYPGAAIKASETPLTIRRRAPLIGEHNAEVYGELGFSKKDIASLKRRGVI